MELVKYNEACRAVAEAKSIDEVKDIMDKSKAIQLYGKQAKNRDIEADGFEIRMRAERRLGQILKETPKATGGDAQRTRFQKSTESPPTLAEMGIDKKLSSSSQKIASLEEKDFEKKVSSGREKIKDAVKSAHVANNSGENEWYTPKKYIDSARTAMKTIDLDPASCEDANKLVKAKKYFTVFDNGLDQKWSGNVWLNPPYSQPLISEFSNKVVSEIKNIKSIIVLVNNATETDWLQKMLSICDAVCFPKSRIKFINKDGEPGGAPLQGQCFVYIGDNVSSFIKEFSQYGEVLRHEI